MGHEISGTVIEVGTNVMTLPIGQHVAVNPALNDRHYDKELCAYCRMGRPNICQRFATHGFSAPGGGFCAQIVVKAISCFPLPDNVSLKVGALAEPVAVAWHCIRLSGMKAGQNILILGAGPIGLAILLLLRVWGAHQILVSEVSETRRIRAEQFGADAVINPLSEIEPDDAQTDRNLVLEAVHQYTEDGVDITFDTSGLQSTLDTAMAATRPSGVIFNVAVHEGPLQLNLSDISVFERQLMGGVACTHEDFIQAINLMSSGKIPFEQMISAVVPLSNVIDGGFMELIHRKDKHVKILIQPDEVH